jgi:hypothetical protein
MQSPDNFVAGHEITLQLKARGVTDRQLKAMRFRPNNSGQPFRQWTFTWGEGIPPAAIPHIFDYCALKWLILENPEHSRDREDASHLVSVATAAPIYRAGINYKETQRLRAKKPRGEKTEKGQSIHSIIERLAMSPEHRDETAEELWFPFFQKLEEAQLRPREEAHLDPRKIAYHYKPASCRPASITRGRFANVVSEFRKKSRQPG